MQPRRLALAAATTLGALAITLGVGGTAQAAPRPPLTQAECRASGGIVRPRFPQLMSHAHSRPHMRAPASAES